MVLGFNVLYRAIVAVGQNWRFGALIVLPAVLFMELAYFPRHIFDLDAAPTDPLSLHFPPILPSPYATWVYLLALLLITIAITISVAIAWHRRLLNQASLGKAIKGQPRWRYLLRCSIVCIFVAIVMLALSWPALLLKDWLYTDAGRDALGLRFHLEALMFVDSGLVALAFAFSWTFFGLSLPGIAAGETVPFGATLKFAVRNIAHIVLAVTLAQLAFHFAERSILIVQYGWRSTYGNWGNWMAALALIVLTSVRFLVLVGLVTEFYRAYRNHHQKQKTPLPT
ncbi:hypothetical protein [Actibacterium lipolyticum]|uniref:Uncharacterized protein n=1 Tax=Actibacterium lipolyticum TaxID=1524263 RepID=A0A238KMP3_9RHOB|nr:hypothetical protein [Actibacterium lipolyticum]SMX44053.1 hypothetical protein COL8621_02452 [Actibacterium lipolyticum]